jgi:hypothetical protein
MSVLLLAGLDARLSFELQVVFSDAVCPGTTNGENRPKHSSRTFAVIAVFSLRARDASSDSSQTDLEQTRIEFGHVRELFVL